VYHHPGEYVTDFCITRHQGVYHLFHIRGERWTWPVGYKEIDLGHAISTDMRLWTPQAPVIPAGPPGAWDEAGIWAPDIIERDGVFYIFYTGSDDKTNQKIGIATSTDLYNWTKYEGNPVVAPGEWSDRDRGEKVAGRDAMVFHDKKRNRYLLYYTATMKDGRPCIALSESTDLLHWSDLGPTYIENDPTYNRCESAYLVEHDDRYYLFYSAKGGPQSKGHSPKSFDHFDIVYLVSDDPTGGWQRPPNHELLKEWMCASEHPTFDGTTYMFYVVQEEVEGIWGASVLSDPKKIAWQPDGTVKVLEHVPDNVARRTFFQASAPQKDALDGWVHQGSTWRSDPNGALAAEDASQEATLVYPLWGEDIVVEAEIEGSADAIASILVRCNASGSSGYRISLDYKRGVLGLYLRLFQHEDTMIQEREVTLTPGTRHKLKVVMQGQFLDAYLDDNLLLVRGHRSFAEGCFGLHSRGSATFHNVHAYEYLGPERIVGNAWQRMTKPRHLFPNG
jgi:beta-fructofuranosidase